MAEALKSEEVTLAEIIRSIRRGEAIPPIPPIPVRVVAPILAGTLESFYDWLLIDDFRREVPVAIDFFLDAGEEGEITLPIPVGKMCIKREMIEAGDPCVEWEAWIDVKHVDYQAIKPHRVASRTLPFVRKWEKREAVYIHYVNNDETNPAWFQIIVGVILVNPKKWDETWKPRLAEVGAEVYGDRS